MNSLRFYIFFNIFNILLIGFILGCISIVCDLVSDYSENANILLLCGLVLQISYIIIKLRLPNWFVKWAKKYDKSIISQFVNYLTNKSDIKKKILLFAFCYDLPFLIYIISQYLDYSFIDAIFYIITWYTILYTGGIFLFYLMLYKEIEKIKCNVNIKI